MIDATTPQLISFLAGAQAKVDDRFKSYPGQGALIEIEIGPKNIRVIKTDTRDGLVIKGGQRSVYCFITRENGDVLKAAGWKAPAPRGKRGNILAEDNGLGCVSGYGCVYLG